MAETLSTVDRCLRALAAFTFERPEIGVTELAGLIGVHKSQAQRLLASLASQNYVVVDPESHRYRLGPALVRLGVLAQHTGGLERAARPVLSALAHQTGETVAFNVAEPDSYTLRAAMDGPGPIRLALTLGRSYPWYAGAGGHAIFAHRPSTEIEALVSAGFTESTAAGPHGLAEILARYENVRSSGYAVSVGEYDVRVMSLAAPVQAGPDVVGSLCIIGMPESLAPQEQRLAPLLLDASRKLANALQAPPS